VISPRDALKRLQEGNLRFVEGIPDDGALNHSQRRADLLSGQAPFAIVLGCADSRVPAELVFDQGLGDLFVIRVAGNVVTPSLLGSVEYAAQACGTRLVVVLGHSSCGAVAATLGEVEAPSADLSANLLSIVDQVRPSVESVIKSNPELDRSGIIAKSVVKQLRENSKLLSDLIEDDGLHVVAAEYSLETGVVDFFDALPD